MTPKQMAKLDRLIEAVLNIFRKFLMLLLGYDVIVKIIGRKQTFMDTLLALGLAILFVAVFADKIGIWPKDDGAGKKDEE